ncbi:MAG: S41 family peptidase [Patescibacteria group bacterium]|jgi:carboxyl-terminal processing protease
MFKYLKIKFQTKVSLWLVMVLICLVFASGVFAGGSNFLINNGNDVIKGIDVNASSSSSTLGSIINSNGKIPDYLTKDVDFNLYWKVWDLINKNHYTKNIPETQLFYGSLAGMVASLNDPYSVFMTPQDASDFQHDLNGNFEGIGAEIAIKNNMLIVVSPLPDTPALKAGLKPKDIILKINGTSTENMRVDTAVGLIRGPKGTNVTLTIFRDGFTATKDVVITRETINVKSVSLEYKGVNNSIAYIKMRQFNDDTTPLLDSAISDLLSKNAKGIILDLRNNPGGYLQTAIDVSSEWIDGQTVVLERDRNDRETKHVGDKPARLANIPTIVLVDGGSASASEIVAGALQDYGKAKLVGMQTFGKGSVQDLNDLPDGSTVKLTIAKWFTPKGRTIDQTGITPDVKVELTETDYNKNLDPQLDKALELLK